MNKTKIEWCDSTWNPITGCLHGCEYCYARKIANRFAPASSKQMIKDMLEIAERDNVPPTLEHFYKAKPFEAGFYPTFYHHRLNEPFKIKKPSNIFVCSMADLFGDWVPDEWIKEVFEACKKAPQHNYMFLTKNFERYESIDDDFQRFWYGATATNKDSFTLALDSFMQQRVNAERWFNTFLSVEPLLEEISISECDGYFSCLDWLILGAETGNRKDKVIPKKEWIDSIVERCKQTNIPIFMKNSLIPIVGKENMLREFPKGLLMEEI